MPGRGLPVRRAGGAALILTVGHGTLAAAEFGALVQEAGITCVVDVRSFPGSRRHPHFGREQMEEWLPGHGVAYEWEPRLGGRRKPVPDSPHRALRVEGFRAYADHMETAEFAEGLERLLEMAGGAQVAVMCAESVWWRCHRRLLSDHLVLVDGVAVEHLMHDGRRNPHRPTEGVRVEGGNRLVYDVGAETSLF